MPIQFHLRRLIWWRSGTSSQRSHKWTLDILSDQNIPRLWQRRRFMKTWYWCEINFVSFHTWVFNMYFSLNASTRLWQKGSWRTDGQHSNPIRVPFYPFALRNPKTLNIVTKLCLMILLKCYLSISVSMINRNRKLCINIRK